MKIISFNCCSCNKENTANLSDLIDLTPMGKSGVSADSEFLRGLGGMVAGGLLSGFSTGRIPNSIALYCKHCNAKNIISLR